MDTGLQNLAAYVHQDFDLDYGSINGAVRAYLVNATAESLNQSQLEIDQLLRRDLDDNTLGRLLFDTYRIYYHAPAEGQTFTNWLTELRKDVRAEVKRRG